MRGIVVVISGYYKEKIKSELAKICEDIFDHPRPRSRRDESSACMLTYFTLTFVRIVIMTSLRIPPLNTRISQPLSLLSILYRSDIGEFAS